MSIVRIHVVEADAVRFHVRLNESWRKIGLVLFMLVTDSKDKNKIG